MDDEGREIQAGQGHPTADLSLTSDLTAGEGESQRSLW